MMKTIVLLVCMGAGLAVGAAQTNAVSAGVRVDTYAGWEGALTISGGDCRVVLLPAVGGRMVRYALNGDNILFEETDSAGKTLTTTPEGFVMGGYQCDVGPESRTWPEHKDLTLGNWRWQAPRPYCLTLESEPDTRLGLRLSKEILVDPDSGEIGLQQRISNISTGAVACCLSDRTVCRGGGFALLPLSKGGRFKAGWAVVRRDASGKTYYEERPPADPRVRVLSQVLVVAAGGAPLTLVTDGDQEWVAYTVGRLLFVKHFPVAPTGRKAEHATVVLFSCDEQRAALQLLAPEARLQPGAAQVLPEKWTLSDLPKSVSNFAEARALEKRIRPWSFKK